MLLESSNNNIAPSPTPFNLGTEKWQKKSHQVRQGLPKCNMHHRKSQPNKRNCLCLTGKLPDSIAGSILSSEKKKRKLPACVMELESQYHYTVYKASRVTNINNKQNKIIIAPAHVPWPFEKYHWQHSGFWHSKDPLDFFMHNCLPILSHS